MCIITVKYVMLNFQKGPPIVSSLETWFFEDIPKVFRRFDHKDTLIMVVRTSVFVDGQALIKKLT